MRKKLLFCIAVALLIGIIFFGKTASDSNHEPRTLEESEKSLTELGDMLLSKGLGLERDNMIFITFEIFSKAKDDMIEIPSKTSEIGWVLFGLTDKGKNIEEIVIPSHVEDKPVIGLFTGAFSQCPNLVSVTIPDTIRYTHKYVFTFCPRLKSITSSGDFFHAVGGVRSPVFVGCDISEWHYSDGLDVEFGFAPWE